VGSTTKEPPQGPDQRPCGRRDSWAEGQRECYARQPSKSNGSVGDVGFLGRARDRQQKGPVSRALSRRRLPNSSNSNLTLSPEIVDNAVDKLDAKVGRDVGCAW